jgi:chorismate mutase / prephenate dehydratase
MPLEDNTLADLRRQIDEIDVRMHDLLMQRAEVVQSIGAAKGDVASHSRPGREAEVLRRLIARHRGPLPKALIVRIWREMFAALTALQGKLAVAVYAPEGTFGYRNLARDQYGWRTPITAYRSAAQVLEAVAEGRATVGVLPVPRGDETDPWWRSLASTGDTVAKVVARLPFAAVEPPDTDNPEALAISLEGPEPTDQDCAFLLVETRQVVSRSHLRALLAAASFEVLDTWVSQEDSGQYLHLIEVAGWVPADDGRLKSLLALGDGTISQAWAGGGYAVPLSLEVMTAPGAGPV